MGQSGVGGGNAKIWVWGIRRAFSQKRAEGKLSNPKQGYKRKTGGHKGKPSAVAPG